MSMEKLCFVIAYHEKKYVYVKLIQALYVLWLVVARLYKKK